MASIFEKTMVACLEGKAKPVNKKDLKESKKRLREEEEVDELTPETADDIADDIVVVVDPELDADDIVAAGEDAQEIIDNTPEGEQPKTDEYVGDYTYTCPICGNTFFSDVEMNEGDECPVCGDFPEDFVLVGKVEDEEPEIEDDLGGDDDFEDFDDELEPADEPEEECRAPRREARRPMRKPMRKEARRPARKPVGKVMRKEARRPVRKGTALRIDETTFNPYLTKFVRENFKNTRSFQLVGAKKAGRRLTLECKLTFKSGKSKKVNLKVENFRAGQLRMAAYEDGTFKTESRRGGKAPFVFMTKMQNGIITCEGLHYDMIARLKEKRARVYGKLMKESRKPMRKPARKPMRKPVRK